MLKLSKIMSACSIITLTLTSNAFAHNAALPDDHAPIGVMGDHNHHKGEWMLSYRYSNMQMDGNRDGTHRLSTAKVLQNYMVAPLDMSMDMHMFGIMYGATDRLTIMAMLPYIEKSMNSITRMGVHSNTKTEGIGDIRLTGLYTLYDSGINKETHRTQNKVLLKLGASLPTGSIDERGNTPAGNNQKLPYPMQLGSGTIDPVASITYVNKHPNWSWGTQAGTVLRFGENDEGYRLGNEYGLTSWVARDVTKYASISFRVDGKLWGDVHGKDNELNPMMAPAARADLRAGKRVDTLVGLNLYQAEGAFAGNRLAAEFGVPIYQELDGPQLETDYRFTLGWQLAF